MGDFNRAVDFVLAERIEGGFVDNPSDPGGATNYGISTRFLRSVGDRRDVRSLSREDAIELYRKYFWDKCLCDQLPDDLALCVFDCSVNQGPGAAGKFLQEELNHYEDVNLAEDGAIGPDIVAAAKLHEGNELEYRYIFRRLQHYAELSDKQQFRQFIRGWLKRMLYLFDEVEE